MFKIVCMLIGMRVCIGGCTCLQGVWVHMYIYGVTKFGCVGVCWYTASCACVSMLSVGVHHKQHGVHATIFSITGVHTNTLDIQE